MKYSEKKSYRLSEMLGVRGGQSVMKSNFHEICQSEKEIPPISSVGSYECQCTTRGGGFKAITF